MITYWTRVRLHRQPYTPITFDTVWLHDRAKSHGGYVATAMRKLAQFVLRRSA